MSEQLPRQQNMLETTETEEGPDRTIVLVTGGTGLVGSHLIKHLVNAGKRVRSLYRSDIPSLTGSENVEWYKGDILDVVSLEGAMKDVAHVYHCAATVSFSRKRKHEMFATNVEGTINVVNEALDAGVQKLCYVSSVAALGKNRKGDLIDESMTWSEDTGTSNYAKSKYWAEAEVWRGIGEGLEAVIVNPSIILGAGDWSNGSSKIFKTAFEAFPWYTEGVTGFVDVQDVVSAMTELMESNISGERFIVSAEDRSYKDIFTAIATAFGKKAPYKKANPFLAGIVTRFEGIKSLFSGQEPLLTKETAETAQAITHFNNGKLKQFLPSFRFTPVDTAIKRICKELREQHNL